MAGNGAPMSGLVVAAAPPSATPLAVTASSVTARAGTVRKGSSPAPAAGARPHGAAAVGVGSGAEVVAESSPPSTREVSEPRDSRRRGAPEARSPALAGDVRLALLSALAATSWQQQVQQATALVSQGASRLRKILSPLPSSFPPGPGGDSAVALAGDPLGTLERLREKYGGAVGIKLAGEPVVVVSDPDLAKDILVTKADIFVKVVHLCPCLASQHNLHISNLGIEHLKHNMQAGTAFFPGSSLAGNGLLVSDGATWRRQRRLANPAFRKSAVDTYAAAMVEASDRLLNNKWNSGGIQDIYGDFNKLTLEVVLTALFGGGEDMEDVGPAVTTAFDFFARRATSMIIVPEWIPTPDNMQYNLAVSQLDRLVYDLIERRRRSLEELSSHIPDVAECHHPVDLLTRMLQVKDDDGSGMSNTALRDELMTLLIAGQETSAILLAWACTLLALHPGSQAKMVAEIDKLVGNERLNHVNCQQLRYTEAVIWETMRLMPPAYIVGRCASESTQLADWHVAAGTTVLVSPYLLHRDPAHWPRALEFDPDRWLEGGDAPPLNENTSYWPFGGGPRNCIGMGFAMMEASLVLASVARRFTLRLPDNEDPPKPRAMITLRPAGEVKIQTTPRT
eukprot:SM000034S12693  [mRNA]  locus=s34:264668:269132:+ [translate_table: standard]